MKSFAVVITAILVLQAALLTSEPVKPAPGKALYADDNSHEQRKAEDGPKIPRKRQVSKRADPQSNEIDDSLNEIFEKSVNPKLVRLEKSAQTDEQSSVDATVTTTAAKNGTAVCDLLRGFMENSANFMSALFSDVVNLIIKFCSGNTTKTGNDDTTTTTTTTTATAAMSTESS